MGILSRSVAQSEKQKKALASQLAHHTSAAWGQRLLQLSAHCAKMSAGHKSMHALSDPPGQPLGLGDGDGDGVGLGLGDGVGEPEVVVPILPNLMSENVTLALPWLDSTSFGSPDVVGQGPRAAPGSEEPTG